MAVLVVWANLRKRMTQRFALSTDFLVFVANLTTRDRDRNISIGQCHKPR
jgi:hypothetical protein